MARPWWQTFVEFTRYMRARGWKNPIIMRGYVVRVIGVASPKQLACRNDNLNQRRRT